MAKGLLILILAASVYFLMRYRHQTKTVNSADDGNFHAVSVEGGLICCSQAEKLQNKRFLSNEAPKIPLPGCDQSVCNCRYKHFNDRRNPNNDRRDNFSTRQELYQVSTDTERRKVKDRRKLKPF